MKRSQRQKVNAIYDLHAMPTKMLTVKWRFNNQEQLDGRSDCIESP